MFSENLLQWYKVYKRDLPWRQESDPYKIWISEVVLQQTRVEQGIKYYQRFTEKYPTVFELAKADDDEILLMWQGLGYYNRALNLLRGAKEIVTRFNGVFPKTAAELKTIRGIGDYTAAAIASIAYNEPLAAIDGNLKRIFSRIGAVEISINSKNFQNTISGEIARVFNFSKAGECNQALMDLGAIVCTPRKPKCMDCPLLAGCFGQKLGIAEKLPIKNAARQKSIRYFWYLVHNSNGSLAFYKRGNTDIWSGLYEFPLVETLNDTLEDFLTRTKELFPAQQLSIQRVDKMAKAHILSHQRIFSSFVVINNDIGFYPKVAYFTKSEIPATHVLIDRYLKNYKV